jgi:hypothetical protein
MSSFHCATDLSEAKCTPEGVAESIELLGRVFNKLRNPRSLSVVV